MRNDRVVHASPSARRPSAFGRTRRLSVEPLEGRLLLAQTTGLFFNLPGTSDGYTLFSPNTTATAYLMDKNGNFVNEWTSAYTPGLLSYMLDNGDLIRASSPLGQGGNGFINAAGSGGLLERFDWDGNKIWEFPYSSPTVLQHHDIEIMPNGHILMIAWELKSEAEATTAGRDPGLPGAGYLYPDHVVEVDPAGNGGAGKIVWQWHVWDHLVQNLFDPADPGVDDTIENYLGPTGVHDHPELIDINYVSTFDEGGGQAEDWNHTNGIDYNADLDQILLSIREFSEVWIIDHSTTTAEAAGHTGGNSGKGGDLLYRWGNPQTYDRGTAGDRVLYYQHDARWVTDDSPGAGDITVFNNGFGQPGTDLSRVEEITTPVDMSGNYTLEPNKAFGPTSTTWEYTGPVENFSAIISGTQRLSNGNTLITYGIKGTMTEVDLAGNILWKYVNPYVDASYAPGGVLGEEDPIPNLGIPGPGLDQLYANFVFKAIDYPVEIVGPLLPPPTVVDVFVNGTSWSTDFLDNIVSGGLGSAEDGYSIPVGDGSQLTSIPRTGIDEITVVFNEPMNVGLSDLSLSGVNVTNYAIAGFSTDAGDVPGTFAATWTLASPIVVDNLAIGIPDSVTSALSGKQLDGEWDNPTDTSDPSSSVYPSGDSFEGGAFSFLFNVAAGDASQDGTVDIADTLEIAADFGATGVFKQSDLNQDGIVDIADTLEIAANFGNTLPGGSPLSGGIGPLALAAIVPTAEPATADLWATGPARLATSLESGTVAAVARPASLAPVAADAALPRRQPETADAMADSATTVVDDLLAVHARSDDGGNDAWDAALESIVADDEL